MNNSHCESAEFLSVAGCLTNAGWIEKFGRHSGGGLKWTAEGIGRLLFLQQIIEEFGLANDVDSAMRFTRNCENQPVTGRMTSKMAAKQFWLACLEELVLPRDTATLWEFVQVVVLGDEALALPQLSPMMTSLRLGDTLKFDGGSQSQQLESQRAGK
jgi:hypothetical protein